MKVGLISDTHGFLDDNVFRHFDKCDEIWHAGDIGTLDLAEKLAAFKPLKAVYGNIDGPEFRNIYPEHIRWEAEGFDVWMTHIGGSPPRYDRQVKPLLLKNTPDIFICGHSHMLKIVTDPDLDNLLYLNPGAAGRQGFHRVRTLLRFDLSAGKIANMQVIELGKRGI